MLCTFEVDESYDCSDGANDRSDYLNDDFNHADVDLELGSSLDFKFNLSTEDLVPIVQQSICLADLELHQPSWYALPDIDSAVPFSDPSSSPKKFAELESTQHELNLAEYMHSTFSTPSDADQPSRLQRRKASNTPIKDWFVQNFSSPYPDGAQIVALTAASGLSPRQVRTCLSNLRARSKPKPISPKTPGNQSIDVLEASSKLSPSNTSRHTYQGFNQHTAPYDTGAYPNPPSNIDSILLESYRSSLYGSAPIGFGELYAHYPAIEYEGSYESAGVPKRKGKKRHLSRYSSTVQHTTPHSPDTSSDSACTLTKAYHCTVCPKSFKDGYGWKRHESSVHGHNDTQWTCMRDEATIVGTRCIFCTDFVDTMDHFDQHNISFCLHKSAAERTFFRKDLFKQHVLLVHLATADVSVKKRFKVPSAWSTHVDVSLENPDALWCGFCQRMLGTVAMRMEHVAEHFQKNVDMTTWLPKAED